MDYSKIRRDYVHKPLRIEEMNPDPFVQFDVWFEFAFQVFGQDTNAMSLATADGQGRPSVRTVLLKGIGESGFIFFTDYESRKGRDLAQQPFAALLFFWPGMDRQVRVEGKVQKVAAAVSDSYFASRPRGSRISAAASPQSERITLEEMEERRKVLEQAEDILRPERWGGYELVPERMEFWQGRESRFHDRIIYEKTSSGEFEMYRIAP